MGNIPEGCLSNQAKMTIQVDNSTQWAPCHGVYVEFLALVQRAIIRITWHPDAAAPSFQPALDC